MLTIKKDIIKQLQEVYDPEISINIFDLGLIYDIQINEEERSVEITHTLTSAFCGFADVIAEDIKNAGYSDNADIINSSAFLSKFTKKFWCHLDSAGVAYSDNTEYNQKGPTGFGVKLLTNFLKKLEC